MNNIETKLANEFHANCNIRIKTDPLFWLSLQSVMTKDEMTSTVYDQLDVLISDIENAFESDAGTTSDGAPEKQLKVTDTFAGAVLRAIDPSEIRKLRPKALKGNQISHSYAQMGFKNLAKVALL